MKPKSRVIEAPQWRLRLTCPMTEPGTWFRAAVALREQPFGQSPGMSPRMALPSPFLSLLGVYRCAPIRPTHRRRG